MFAARDEFLDNINGLIQHLQYEEKKDLFFRELVKDCQPQNLLYNLVRQHLTDVVKPSTTSSKEFNYTSSIIALYGYLENYLEKLAEEFIDSLNQAKIPVSKLPQEIRELHLKLSMRFLDQVSRNRTQEETEKRATEIEVIKNLQSFLQGDDDYALNRKAFSVHTANFRYDLIQTYFSQVGVKGIAERTLGFETVKNGLANRQGQEPSDQKSVMRTWLESELSELAQLRNEIAHGAFERNIETFNLIIERANFLKCFGEALAEILHRSLKEIIYDGTDRHVLGYAKQTFPKQRCFGFMGKLVDGTEEQFRIKIGDKIFAKNCNSGDKIIIGSIESLMQDRKQVTHVEFPSESDFSIKVNFEVSNNMTNRELSITK
ncbi:hypothetical protein NMR73_000930 [Vibrio navarrensis]|nr:hypothetical protein [Vibrio navarrensis]EJL6566596.1 hypothetical protein [Vibrio navarrensis]